MPADLNRLDRDALRAALARAETAVHVAAQLLEGAEGFPLEKREDLGRVLARVYRCSRAMGEAGEHLESLLNTVAQADPETVRVMMETLS